MFKCLKNKNKLNCIQGVVFIICVSVAWFLFYYKPYYCSRTYNIVNIFLIGFFISSSNDLFNRLWEMLTFDEEIIFGWLIRTLTLTSIGVLYGVNGMNLPAHTLAIVSIVFVSMFHVLFGFLRLLLSLKDMSKCLSKGMCVLFLIWAILIVQNYFFSFSLIPVRVFAFLFVVIPVSAYLIAKKFKLFSPLED